MDMYDEVRGREWRYTQQRAAWDAGTACAVDLDRYSEWIGMKQEGERKGKDSSSPHATTDVPVALLA